MGMITACFGGIIRDTLSQERSIIFSYEIYVTAALAAAITLVGANALGIDRQVGVSAAFGVGFALRGGAIMFGWSLPRYRQRQGRTHENAVAEGHSPDRLRSQTTDIGQRRST